MCFATGSMQVVERSGNEQILGTSGTTHCGTLNQWRSSNWAHHACKGQKPREANVMGFTWYFTIASSIPPHCTTGVPNIFTVKMQVLNLLGKTEDL